MPYVFQPKKLYRMPTHFGPSLGPRQGPDGRRFTEDKRKWTTYSVSFLSNREQLEALVPPGFSIEEEPVVTVTGRYMTEIPWLAGRGYNMLGVYFPVTFREAVDHVKGDLLMVLWENLAEAIMTGREELGFAKIYCELPTPQVYEDRVRLTANWQGYRFFDMLQFDLQPTSQEDASGGRSEGVLHYKYIPKTEDWGEADVAYATFTPAAQESSVVLERWRGKGRLSFHEASWEDLPTQCDIVNTLAALEIQDYLGASVVKGYGSGDISHQRILR